MPKPHARLLTMTKGLAKFQIDQYKTVDKWTNGQAQTNLHLNFFCTESKGPDVTLHMSRMNLNICVFCACFVFEGTFLIGTAQMNPEQRSSTESHENFCPAMELKMKMIPFLIINSGYPSNQLL